MEIHVHSYLSRYFEIKPNKEGTDCVYYLDDKSNDLIYGEKLVKELTTVFGITKDESKKFVNIWALKVNPKVNLEFYWSNHESIFGGIFPLVQQVAARTIGLDLVAVQPLAAPKGELFYMDFSYTGAGETQTATTQNYEVADNDAGRRWDNIIQLFENQQLFDGELGRLDNT